MSILVLIGAESVRIGKAAGSVEQEARAERRDRGVFAEQLRQTEVQLHSRQRGAAARVHCGR